MASAPLVAVTFFPSRLEVQVAAGTTLLEAARAAGLPMGCSCRGEAACGACRVQVLEGERALSQPGERESRRLHRMRASPGERLACEARAYGPVRFTTAYW